MTIPGPILVAELAKHRISLGRWAGNRNESTDGPLSVILLMIELLHTTLFPSGAGAASEVTAIQFANDTGGPHA